MSEPTYGEHYHSPLMNPKLSVLLTGAAGSVGIGVRRQLHLSGKYRVTAFEIRTRDAVRALWPFRNEVEVIHGDITNAQDIESACKEKDVVIHLAALIPPAADEKPELAYQVNVGGTENLIRALEEHSPKAFLLYSSSVSIYGDRVAEPNIRVSDPAKPSARDEYALTKIAAEELIQKSKLSWSIFRLGAVMGRHKITKLMFHQPLNTSFELVTREDTARAFVNAIEKRDQLSGRIFNLGGGEKCRSSYEEFLERSFEIAGLGKLDFAPKSFAEKNFHCAYYADGDELENILHFRRDTLDSYFQREREKTSAARKVITSILRKPIKYFMQRSSEPLRAFRTKDVKESQHYFHT